MADPPANPGSPPSRDQGGERLDPPAGSGAERLDSPRDQGGEVREIRAGATVWRFDVDFLTSNWTCIWGRGCLGIEDEAAPELGLGCCAVGAVFADEDEARRTAALAATLDPARWEHHAAASSSGIFADEGRTATRVVDGGCIFLNRPGFAGGAGCALHLEALEAGDAPGEWKPSVCAELPIKVDWEPGPDGDEIATVRRWARRDWGEEGRTMAWCCTEGKLAYVGEDRVVDSLRDELTSIVGADVYLQLRRLLDP